MSAVTSLKWFKEKSNESTQPAHLYLPWGRLGSRACRPLHRFALLWLLGETQSWREDRLYTPSLCHTLSHTYISGYTLMWLSSDPVELNSRLDGSMLWPLNYKRDNLDWLMEICTSEIKLKAVCGNSRPFSFDCQSELEPRCWIQALVLAAIEEISKVLGVWTGNFTLWELLKNADTPLFFGF